jgi:hypothetical protein
VVQYCNAKIEEQYCRKARSAGNMMLANGDTQHDDASEEVGGIGIIALDGDLTGGCLTTSANSLMLLDTTGEVV